MSTKLKHGHRWGGWELDARNFTLQCYDIPETYGYEIDLEEIETAADELDWIIHLHDKTWMTPEHLDSLVSAFRDIFGYTLCGSFGRKDKIDATKFMKGRIAVPRKAASTIGEKSA